MKSRFAGLKVWQIGVLAAVLAIGFGGSYLAYVLLTGSDDSDAGEGRQLVPVTRGNLVNDVSIDGSVTYPNREVLYFDVQGRVGQVLVEEGQAVSQGQPLAVIEAESAAALEEAVAEAQVKLRDAQDALDDANSPYTALDAAQAESGAAEARLALRDAQESLAKLLSPDDHDLTRAESNVVDARASLSGALDALSDLIEDHSDEAAADLRSQVDSAQDALAVAEMDLELASTDGDDKVSAAAETAEEAEDAYLETLHKWLGIDAGEDDAGSSPETLLESWGIDLESVFSGRMGLGTLLEGPPADDPDTPWDELVVYFWLNLYPGDVMATCVDTVVPAETRCVSREMDQAWDALYDAVFALETAEANAARSLSKAEAEVDKADAALDAAEEALADLLAGPGLDLQKAQQKAALARTDLDKAEEALLDLVRPSQLDVAAAEKMVLVARAKLDDALDELERVLAGPDPLDVALRRAEVVSALTALDSAEEALQDATLRAPWDGVVSQVHAEAGQSVNSTTPVLEVLDPSVVEIDGIVDEIDVLLVREGARASVVMDALGGQALEGAVAEVGSVARSQSGVVTYPISIQVGVPAGLELPEGLSAVATVVLREEADVLLVPIDALFGSFDRPIVRVSEDGRLVDREVALGGNDGFWVAVEEGLSEGEVVLMQSTQADSPFGFGGFRGLGGGPGGGLGGGFSIEIRPPRTP